MGCWNHGRVYKQELVSLRCYTSAVAIPIFTEQKLKRSFSKHGEDFCRLI